VTRKVTRAVARIHKEGGQEILYLGNLDAKRDWGHAREYVEAMWLMLQHDTPADYVIATGETHSVRELVEVAFGVIGIKIKWEGEGVDEVGLDASNNKIVRVKVNPKYYRPTEVDLLLGNPAKAKAALGWSAKITFEALIKEMVLADIALLEKGDKIS